MNTKKILFCIAVVCCVSMVGGYVTYQYLNNVGHQNTEETKEEKTEVFPIYNIPYTMLKQKVVKYGLDQSVCFYVDYAIPSGTPRFFICDLTKDSVLYADYCMHGPGNGSTAEKPVFSNTKGSNCSSLGAFSVFKGKWGATLGEKRSRLIKGLESTNSNAVDRTLMIHDSYYLNGVVASKAMPKFIPLNKTACSGCVTITPTGFQRVRKYVKDKEKNILLHTGYQDAK